MALAAAVLAMAAGAAAHGADVLDTPVSATWSAVPLRDWAARATVLAGRPVVIDRRLDPDTTVTRDCRGEPLGEVLDAVADAVGGTCEPLRSWIRIGPAAARGRATAGERERTARLATLPEAARAVLGRRRDWAWNAGARPRDLVAAAATEAGVALDGLDAVPHDHLPAASLPPLSLAERLDLVLADHDLRVSWTAGDDAPPRGAIVALPDAAPPTAGGGAAPRRTPPAPRPRLPADRFTLKLAAPLDTALDALGPRLGLEPVIDRESLAARGILPGEIVRAEVTDATPEQVLDAIVAPLGLRWRVDGGRLVIDAPPPP